MATSDSSNVRLLSPLRDGLFLQQTITTGFLVPGRGRYIHPIKRRVITPREAARLQSIPDSFRFVVNGHDPKKAALTKWIGDAVPPLLGYAATIPLLTRF